MLGKLMKYEIRRAALPFAVLYGIMILLSIWIKLTDTAEPSSSHAFIVTLPLIYGTAGINVWRYYQRTFTNEAAFEYSLPFGNRKFFFGQLVVMLIFSAVSTIVHAMTLLLIGNAPGEMIQMLNPISAAALFSETAFSMFFLSVELSALLSIAGLFPFRKKQKVWFAVFFLLSFGIDYLEKLLEKYLSLGNIFINGDGSITLRAMPVKGFAVNVSVVGMICEAGIAAISILFLYWYIQKALVVTE